MVSELLAELLSWAGEKQTKDLCTACGQPFTRDQTRAVTQGTLESAHVICPPPRAQIKSPRHR